MSKLGGVKREEGGSEGKREERKREKREKSESSESDFSLSFFRVNRAQIPMRPMIVNTKSKVTRERKKISQLTSFFAIRTFAFSSRRIRQSRSFPIRTLYRLTKHSYNLEFVMIFPDKNFFSRSTNFPTSPFHSLRSRPLIDHQLVLPT